MLLKRISPILGLMLMVTACAQGPRQMRDAPPAGGSDAVGDPAAPAQINWNDLYHGPKYPSIAAANDVLPFAIEVPSLGQPAQVTTPDPHSFPPGTLPVALIYDISSVGRVIVQEQLHGQQTLAHLQELAATYGPEQADGIPDGPAAPSPEQTPESSVVDPMVMVPLRGTEALLIQSNDGRGRLISIEGPLQFDVFGPTLTVEQVTAIAQEI